MMNYISLPSLYQLEWPQSKKRMVAKSYSVQTDETKSIVCKKLFRATLDIEEEYINHALKGKSEVHFQGFDKNGRHMHSL